MLPFTNMSGDPEQEYFADGITEDIITDLSKVSALSVIARNSVFTYKGKHADVQEVGRRFNVAYVLEGSVRKAGQRVRITAQLIDAKDGTHLWADRYDRDLTEIFAMQDEITKTIVEQLKVKLLPQERKAIEAAPTQDIDAYNYYLQRPAPLSPAYTSSTYCLAQRMFNKAVELDPNYARAYAGLADCAWFLYNDQHEGTTVEDIHAASLKALELDPDLAEAHASYGMALHYLDRYAEAVDEFEQAIRLDPNLFEAYYFCGFAARDRGDLGTAVRMPERCVAIQPEDYRERLILGDLYDEVGRHEEARRAIYDRRRACRARTRCTPRCAAGGHARLRCSGSARPDGARTRMGISCPGHRSGRSADAI